MGNKRLRLKTIHLRNYRNYEELTLETSDGVNIFIGPNAQGKTNLLEAVNVLALTKSHRTHSVKELIRWGSDQAALSCRLDKKYGTHQLDLSLTKLGKVAKVNGLEQKKLSHYVGTMNVVLFAPEDLYIIKGTPTVRRRFLNMEIGQVQPSYFHEVNQYEKVLSQRNNFLKQLHSGSSHGSILEIWNEQLAGYGIKIMKKRQSFINKLQLWAQTINSQIAGEGEQLRISYSPSFDMEAEPDDAVLFERYMIKLSQTSEQDLRRGITSVGPHRDDLLFHINGKEVQTFGSQGQQRTAALSLKLAEIELIHEETGEFPILLLDDVMSELDERRQLQIIHTFTDKLQTFITATGTESIHSQRMTDAKLYRIREGCVHSTI
jgi:DNA replication and repair protein RecF